MHINPAGDCCIMVWEEWLVLAPDTSFRGFLRGPVHDYFLNQWWFEKKVYPVHVMTRKSFGLMKRKLSVTESQRSAQFPGHCFTQETKRRIGELGACGVAFVVSDVSVHEAPQPLDRIEMRAIGRGEMQLDPAPGSRKPFLHQLGVMIARVVEKTWMSANIG